jgi:hypothetical protein
MGVRGPHARGSSSTRGARSERRSRVRIRPAKDISVRWASESFSNSRSAAFPNRCQSIVAAVGSYPAGMSLAPRSWPTQSLFEFADLLGRYQGAAPTRPNAILAMVQSTYGHVPGPGPGPGPGAPERKRWLQCLRRLAGTCRMRPRQPSPRRRRRSPSCRHAPSRGLDASPGIRSGTAGPTKPESKVRLRRSDATWSSSDALLPQPGAWIRRARPAKLCRPWARHGLSV